MLGGRPITFVNGVVLSGDGQRFRTLRVSGRRVDRLGAEPGPRDAIVDLEHGFLFPGLINAHDHLELNSFPRLKWRPQYGNVREWIADFQPRFASDPSLAAARPETLADRVWVGALKNALSGVTTVCHHNPLHSPVRRRLPVRVVRRFGLSHSLQVDGSRIVSAHRRTPSAWPWIIHAAEGTDEEAGREIDALDVMGCLAANTVLVHGVAVTDADATRVIARGGSLVWCPSSNDFLFGRTADVRRFAEAGRLALGTDSRLSGAGDLLDELREALATGQLAAPRLVRAVTADGAAALRLPRAGRLASGFPADLVVLPRLRPDPHDALVAATRRDVRLTMIDGRPLVAEPALAGVFAAVGQSCRSARVDGAPRLLARWIADRAAALSLAEPGLEVEP